MTATIKSNHTFRLIFPNGRTVGPGATVGMTDAEWEEQERTDLVQGWLRGGHIELIEARAHSDDVKPATRRRRQREEQEESEAVRDAAVPEGWQDDE